VSAEGRAQVPHHGLDLVDPDEPFSVADFVDHAKDALAAIARRRRLALLVGGTGLYLRAVARGLPTEALPSDPRIRAEIETELGRDGVEAAARRLSEIAPNLARRTDLRNPRRVARALEIAVLQGDAPLPGPAGYPGPSAWIGVDVPSDVLRERLARRAADQFAAGLLDEAAALRARYDPGLPCFSAIGYREAFAALDGELDLAAAIALDTRRNIAFARRQRTWFRAEPGIQWLPSVEDALTQAAETARRLLEAT
jgi:tRNA dimethylallyltransferase